MQRLSLSYPSHQVKNQVLYLNLEGQVSQARHKSIYKYSVSSINNCPLELSGISFILVGNYLTFNGSKACARCTSRVSLGLGKHLYHQAYINLHKVSRFQWSSIGPPLYLSTRLNKSGYFLLVKTVFVWGINPLKTRLQR